MATALTLKQAIAAVWQKFMGVIGYEDISGIGDGTVTGAIAGLNGNLKIKQTYATLGVNEHGMISVRSICPDDKLINVILLNEQYEIRQITTDSQVFYRIFNVWTGNSVSTGNYYVKVIYVE